MIRFAGLLCLVLLGCSALPGCTPTQNMTADEKMDARLRMALNDAEPDARVSCLIELTSPPRPEDGDALREAGLRVTTVAGTTIVAEGTAESLRRAAALPRVRQMSLSQTRPPFR